MMDKKCPVCNGPGKIQFTEDKGKPYVGCDAHKVEAIVMYLHHARIRREATLAAIKRGTFRWLFCVMLPMSVVVIITSLVAVTTKWTWVFCGIFVVLGWVAITAAEVMAERNARKIRKQEGEE